MKQWWRKSFLERHPRIRLAVNIILIFVSIILMAWLYWTFRSNLIVIIIMTFLLIGLPLLQRHGRAMLEKQRVIAIYQFKNDMKINVDRKKVALAYFEMFIVCWVFLILAFLPPWPNAWAILFFPTIVIYTLHMFMWAHTWEDFDHKMHTYYLMHLGVSVLCVIISLTIKTIFFTA